MRHAAALAPGTLDPGGRLLHVQPRARMGRTHPLIGRIGMGSGARRPRPARLAEPGGRPERLRYLAVRAAAGAGRGLLVAEVDPVAWLRVGPPAAVHAADVGVLPVGFGGGFPAPVVPLVVVVAIVVVVGGGEAAGPF